MTYYVTFMSELKRKNVRLYDARPVNNYPPLHPIDPTRVAAMPPKGGVIFVGPLRVRNAETKYPRDGAVVEL